MAVSSSSSFLEAGGFTVGVNYWASHAGIDMWRRWDEGAVDADLAALARNGVQSVRVFPLWRDFQPIHLLRRYLNAPYEHRFGELPLPDTAAGRAGMSEDAMQHFSRFLELAAKHHLTVIVGLITGWMSGRVFVPPALESANLLKDPVAIQWQVRFVNHFVGRFRDHAAIVAWELGNECNCMSVLATSEEAWCWTAAITGAIRAADPTRPVLSGMHSLKAEFGSPWSITDQAELTDMLTAHPYPMFTPHNDRDPLNTTRSIMHSTAESRFYADIGSKPCVVEELGTLGAAVGDDAVVTAYVRTVLYSLWANDCRGLFWWCGFDQDFPNQAPYSWYAVEREPLGMLRADRTPKSVAAELSAFRKQIDALPFDHLPARLTEAVCIVSDNHDAWGVAYASFILAKQAGFDLTFQTARQPLRDAPLYLLPSIRNDGGPSHERLQPIFDRVRGGATLYVSGDAPLFSGFAEQFGVSVKSRRQRISGGTATYGTAEGDARIALSSAYRFVLAPCGAEVLATEPDSSPLFTRFKLGEGWVYFLGVPLETTLAREPGVFEGSSPASPWQVYRQLIEVVKSERLLKRSPPQLAVTEHPTGKGRIVVAINHDVLPVETVLSLTGSTRLGRTLRGAATASDGGIRLKIAANDVAIFELNM
jgi:hypothetical protein